jgi:hypothetical protein
MYEYATSKPAEVILRKGDGVEGRIYVFSILYSFVLF